MTFWDEHGAVLRSRNLAAQEGDDRFREARNRSLTQISNPLAKRIAESQRAGRVAADINPLAAAAAMVAMMERMAAFRPRPRRFPQRHGRDRRPDHPPDRDRPKG